MAHKFECILFQRDNLFVDHNSICILSQRDNLFVTHNFICILSQQDNLIIAIACEVITRKAEINPLFMLNF